MTGEEFAAGYAAGSGVTVGFLRYHGRYPEPCSCGAELCQGYIMGHQHEDALFEETMRREAEYVAALPGRMQEIADQLSAGLPDGYRLEWSTPEVTE